MEKKLRSITDNLHNSIYLSTIEAMMMSTPFFYRLHDVYQSSTVYMTFPSNRTKRYEHSLGTMYLSGQMFFASVANASKESRTIFMKQLEGEFQEIVSVFDNRKNATRAFYIEDSQVKRILSQCIPASECKYENIKTHIIEGMNNGVICDPALEQQEFNFFGQLISDDNNFQSVGLFSFFYQCVLEAIRLAALFHDVGHPPYSHIIEKTLRELLKLCQSEMDVPKLDLNKQRVESIVNHLTPFISTIERPELLLKNPSPRYDDEQSKKKKDPALHEQIGLKMFQSSVNNIFYSLCCDAKQETDLSFKITKAFYYITVVEFAFAILLEHSPIFAALHRILDGPIDADRMDYINRDAQNSGIDWGRTPYTRIVNSAKMICKDENFVIAFPEKMSDDLDDIIIARYKIFNRINYHHRSVKTTKLLQTATYEIALDYLYGSDEQSMICSQISNLWESLGTALGQDETENKIAKWNDSWLISALHEALINLSDTGLYQKLIRENLPTRSEDKLDRLKRILEELLLNHKYYYALLKRQKDAADLMTAIVAKANITSETLDKLLKSEYAKLISSTRDADIFEAMDSLYRIGNFQTKICQKANFDELEICFLFQPLVKIIGDLLETAKSEGLINDYLISPNDARDNLGTSSKAKDTIYLYKKNDDFYPYNTNCSLRPLLLAHRATGLWLNIYIDVCTTESTGEVLRKLNERIVDSVGTSLRNNFKELFPSISV